MKLSKDLYDKALKYEMKKEAIAFAEWIVANVNSSVDKETWYRNGLYYNTEQLYTLFLKEQKAQVSDTTKSD